MGGEQSISEVDAHVKGIVLGEAFACFSGVKERGVMDAEAPADWTPTLASIQRVR